MDSIGGLSWRGLPQFILERLKHAPSFRHWRIVGASGYQLVDMVCDDQGSYHLMGSVWQNVLDFYLTVFDWNQTSILKWNDLFSYSWAANSGYAWQPSLILKVPWEPIQIARTFKQEVGNGWVMRGLFSVEMRAVMEYSLDSLSQDWVDRSSQLNLCWVNVLSCKIEGHDKLESLNGVFLSCSLS